VIETLHAETVIGNYQGAWIPTDGVHPDQETDSEEMTPRLSYIYIRNYTRPDTVISNVYDSQSLNRYVFERGSPYKNKDDTGHDVSEINEARPHMSLNYKTPHEVWQELTTEALS
jgi:hypothetical protein